MINPSLNTIPVTQLYDSPSLHRQHGTPLNTFSEETFPRVNLVDCKNTRYNRSLFLTAGQLDNKHPSTWAYPRIPHQVESYYRFSG